MVKFRGGSSGWGHTLTVRNCGSTSPSWCDISHHCQLSGFRVRMVFIISWLKRLLLNERSRIFMNKGSKHPSRQKVGQHQCWGRSLATFIYLQPAAYCARTGAPCLSADIKHVFYKIIYLKCCGSPYVLSKRSHVPSRSSQINFQLKLAGTLRQQFFCPQPLWHAWRKTMLTSWLWKWSTF